MPAQTAPALPQAKAQAPIPAQAPVPADHPTVTMQVQAQPLRVDRDPVRSPDAQPAGVRQLRKQGEGYVLHTDVDEVELNCTVLRGSELVSGLKKEDFRVAEDGVRQKIISFQHTDLPVSFALVVDNSGSMAGKRPAVNKAALDLIAASNPQDEAFVVNFSDEAFIDQEFTSSPAKLRAALSRIDARGGTALYDAVAASADTLAADGKHPKQVLILITDGEDDASSLSQDQAIRRVRQLSGPEIYSIGLLFGPDLSRTEAKIARKAVGKQSPETGGIAIFPKNLGEVDAIAAEVAQDIRSQYTIGYHSTKPISVPGFRTVLVEARAKGEGKLTVRTRTGYFPSVRLAKNPAAAEQ